MVYCARETDASAVAEALVALWRRNLPVARDDPSVKLDWFYGDGPAGPGRVILLERDGAEAVGCAGVGMRLFSLAGTPAPVPVGLLADLAVDKLHRTLLPALTLAKTARTTARRLAPMHYGFPNSRAVALFDRLGYTKLGVVTRWVRILRHAGYVARVLANPLLARAAGAILDAERLLELVPLRLASLPLRLESVDRPDARFDRLFRVARRQYGAIGWRGADFLRWRFRDRPGHASEIIALVERRHGAVRAYAVLDRLDGAFHIADFLGVGPTDLGFLIDLLVLLVRGRGAATLSVSFLGSPRIEALLRGHRFVARQATRTVVVDARPGQAVPPPQAWYLTDADEDV